MAEVEEEPVWWRRKQGVNGDGNEMIAPFGVAVERHQLRRGGGQRWAPKSGGACTWAGIKVS
jgi:hypothetical protein